MLKFLIVEDNFLIAIDLEAQLLEMGHGVIGIATTAPAAIAMAGGAKPDVAIIDLQLAEGTRGQDAAIALWQDFGIPSIIVSGSLHQISDAEETAIHPLAMLSKPLMPDELRRVIDIADLATSPKPG
ncbi:response regulator [Loktanella sp. TSTF-M6]|uniref:Response regulator n=1 Tax=Loktanella gaetbuli TaxID=2881335 RepID=A0ABS8BST2_9RHOB|nr:response regulator [Loktanella gaetbuli]MCB5198800.1 response regulator [Loktanella gaetbuli]